MLEGYTKTIIFAHCSLSILIAIADGRGPTCLNCKHVIGPKHCHSVIACLDDETCVTNMYRSENGEMLFDIGCLPIQACPSDSAVFRKQSQRSSRSYQCIQCCKGDLCNAQGCGQIGYPSDRGPICFSCQQSRNASTCDVISSCEPHEMCQIKEIIEYGEKFYTTGCESKHACESHYSIGTAFGKRNSRRNIRIGCSTCCQGDLCNSQCSQGSHQKPSNVDTTTESPVTTTTTIPTTTVPTTTVPTTTQTPLSQGHYGTEYILVFATNTFVATDVEIIITATRDTIVTIESLHPGINRTIAVPAVNGASVLLPHTVVTDSSSTVEGKGILIKSTYDIAVYGMLHSRVSNKGEGFYAIPTRNLGDFYASHTIRGRYNTAIVSYEDSTSVNVTVGYPDSIMFNSHIYRYNETFSFSLNKYETIQLRSKSFYLMGTLIRSNNRIGVLIFEEQSGDNGGLKNYNVEYLPPVPAFGRNFVIPPFEKAYKYQVLTYIYTTKYDTSPPIWKTNDINTEMSHHFYSFFRTYNKGSALRMNEGVYLITTPDNRSPNIKPFMTQIPAISQFSNNYRIRTPNIGADNFISVMALSSDIGGIILDNTPLTRTFPTAHTVRLEHDDYSVLNASISVGHHVIHHPDSNVVFGLIMYGYTDSGESYGYPAGLRVPAHA